MRNALIRHSRAVFLAGKPQSGCSQSGNPTFNIDARQARFWIPGQARNDGVV